MTNRRLLIILGALLIVIGAFWITGAKFSKYKLFSTSGSESSKNTRPPSRLNLYSNEAVGLDFAYPFDFRVLKNDLGDSFDGIFEAKFDHTFGSTTESNAIIVGISRDDKSIITEMERDRSVETRRINKKTYRVEHVYYQDGSEIKNYFVLLPSDKDFYLKFSISGTSANFYYLDDLIASIKWR